MPVPRRVIKATPDITPPRVTITADHFEIIPGNHFAPDGSVWRLKRAWGMALPTSPVDVWLVKTDTPGEAAIAIYDIDNSPPPDLQVDRLIWHQGGDYHYLEFTEETKA